MNNTILIVDDDPMISEMLELILEQDGFQLEVAHNGSQALEKARAIIPDVILLDVMMPDMNGFDVCREFRNDPILAEVPVIMVTALGDRRSHLTGIEAGADDFVTKPFDTVLMRARLKTMMRLNRYRGLLQERSKFQWVVEQSDDGYLILGANQEVVYSNSQARSYLNISESPDDNLSFLQIAKHFTVRQ